MKRPCLVQLLGAILVVGVALTPAPSAQALTLVLRVRPMEVPIGDSMAVVCRASGPLEKPVVLFQGRRIPLFPLNSWNERGMRYGTYVGIDLKGETGPRPLFLEAVTEEGRKIREEVSVRVVARTFPEQRIELPPDRLRSLRGKALLEEARLLQKHFQSFSPRRFWSGPFVPPVSGPVTAAFGLRRIYNGGILSWHHKGVDLASTKGNTVVAPNSGRILLSRDLEVHGGTIIIDHGQGVHSVLIHLSQRFLKRGDTVAKGEPIGRVGMTGAATGPHVHWGLSVGGVRVDPLPWVERAMDREVALIMPEGRP